MNKFHTATKTPRQLPVTVSAQDGTTYEVVVLDERTGKCVIDCHTDGKIIITSGTYRSIEQANRAAKAKVALQSERTKCNIPARY